MASKMPAVGAGGRVVITPVGSLTGEEVRLNFNDGRVLYVKQRRDEAYDAFIERVVRFCEERV